MFGSASEASQLIYLPVWAKVTIVFILSFGLLMGVYVSVSFINVPEKTDWILLSVGVAQLAATGLILALVLLFSELDANTRRLEQRADQFLKVQVKSALAKITIPEKGINKVSVTNKGKKDIFGDLFIMEGVNGFKFKMWVGINVNRIFVIYFVRGNGNENSADKLQEIFKYTLGGAESVGYQVNFEDADVSDEKLTSIWMTAPCGNKFLTSPVDKLYWSQDVAMMTQSFLRTAFRNDTLVSLETDADPSPL